MPFHPAPRRPGNARAVRQPGAPGCASGALHLRLNAVIDTLHYNISIKDQVSTRPMSMPVSTPRAGLAAQRRRPSGMVPFAWSAGRRLAVALAVVALLWLAVCWANGWFAFVGAA